MTEDIAVLNRGDAVLLKKIEEDVWHEILKFADHIANSPKEEEEDIL